MNMNSDQPDFTPLRRLLKLKRYEQPPPRYFNEFSGNVISRIRAGGRVGSANAIEEQPLVAQWWQRLVAVVQNGPVLAGTCAAALFALFMIGVVRTENSVPAAADTGLAGLLPQAVATPPPVFGPASALGFEVTNADSSLSPFFDIPLSVQRNVQRAGSRVGGE